jgi:hypothetical protein
MQDQRKRDASPEDSFTEEQLDSAVLDFMLYDGSWPWSLDELGRELGHKSNAEDAVRRLTRAGLVHRLDGFVFPTRTARRASVVHKATA